MLRPGILTLPDGDTRKIWSPARFAIVVLNGGHYGVMHQLLDETEALVICDQLMAARSGLWKTAEYFVVAIDQPVRGDYELQADAMLAIERAGDKWGRLELLCGNNRSSYVDYLEKISSTTTKAINSYRQGLKYEVDYYDTLAKHEIARGGQRA